MRIIADTHVHFYPCYDIANALGVLYRNLERLDGNAIKAVFLTERNDCRFFADIKSGKLHLSGENIRISVIAGGAALEVAGRNGFSFYIFPGRQVVTAERLEILSLTVDAEIPDNLPVLKVIELVNKAGGVPVLGWSPGKWFFERGRIVREVIESHKPDQLVISDSTLRPSVWPEPIFMKMAFKKGFSILAGSDTLPFSGDEKYMGTYASLIEGQFDAKDPVKSIRRMLRQSGHIARVGKRCGLIETIYRLANNAKTRKLAHNF